MDLTKDQLRTIIQEELEAVLAEDCWDGYVRNYDVPEGAPGSCKKKTNEEDLRSWFDDADGDGQTGWEQIGGKYDGKPCAKQPGQKTKPKCASPEKAASMSKKERDSAAARKRKQDPNPDRKGKAKNVNTDPKRKKK